MTKANNYGGNPDGLGTKSYRIRQENHDLVCGDYCDHNEHQPSCSAPLPARGKAVNCRGVTHLRPGLSFLKSLLNPVLGAKPMTPCQSAGYGEDRLNRSCKCSDRGLFRKRHDEPDYSGAM